MFGIQAFINSDMFPKFLKGLEKFANMIVDFGNPTFNYISELYDIFLEGGGFAGLKQLQVNYLLMLVPQWVISKKHF